MKFISWDVDGIHARLNSNFATIFKQLDADFFGIQQTRLQGTEKEQINLPGYYQYWDNSKENSYAGIAMFTKFPPLKVTTGLNDPQVAGMGRVQTLEYNHFYLINLYAPFAGEQLQHLNEKNNWYRLLKIYIQNLLKNKGVIIMGNFSVAYQNIDIFNPEEHGKQEAGFTPVERADFGKLLDLGLIDSFRYFYPNKTGAYTWWSRRGHEREQNKGWRMDYILVSKNLLPEVQGASILNNILGSDHAPIELNTKDLFK